MQGPAAGRGARAGPRCCRARASRRPGCPRAVQAALDGRSLEGSLHAPLLDFIRVLLHVSRAATAHSTPGASSCVQAATEHGLQLCPGGPGLPSNDPWWRSDHQRAARGAWRPSCRAGNSRSAAQRPGGRAAQPKHPRIARCCQTLLLHAEHVSSPSKRAPPVAYSPHPPARPGGPPAASMGNRASREAGAGDGSSSAAGLPAAAAAAAGGAPHPGAAAGQAPPPECPASPQFKGQVYKNPAVYNVYNQRINDPAAAAAAASPLSGLPGQDVLDPKNNMPLEPNQQPCPGQKRLLSTERQASNIPKGGTESTWVYPSPQMFFNGAPPAEPLLQAG